MNILPLVVEDRLPPTQPISKQTQPPNLDCIYYTFSGVSGGVKCSTSFYFDTDFSETAKANASFVLQDSVQIASNQPCGNFPQISQNTFIACAAGSVSSNWVTDGWFINQNKTLVNFLPGI